MNICCLIYRNENEINMIECKFRDALLKLLYLNLQKYDSKSNKQIFIKKINKSKLNEQNSSVYSYFDNNN